MLLHIESNKVIRMIKKPIARSEHKQRRERRYGVLLGGRRLERDFSRNRRGGQFLICNWWYG